VNSRGVLEWLPEINAGHTVTVGGWRSDEARWPENQDAMSDAMVRLEQALRPQIAALKSDFL
jgi:hypothetical protein